MTDIGGCDADGNRVTALENTLRPSASPCRERLQGVANEEVPIE